MLLPRALTQLLLLGTLTAAILNAQGPSGVAVTGTVLDPHQAGALGAKVTLKLADGTEVQSTSADSLGVFRFADVPPGNYDVQIEQQGFKPSVSRVRLGTQAPGPSGSSWRSPSYVGVLSSPFFGKPIAAQPPRRLQASFRFRF